MEAELVQRSLNISGSKLSFLSIPAAGVHGVGMRALPGNILKLLRGYFASRKIIRTFKPDVLFYTGGYLAVPMALAARRIPAMAYVPDIEPGLALKTLARFSTRVAVTTSESRQFFSSQKKITISGYPVRSELSRWKRAEAFQVLNLQDNLPVLLVSGGSKGARSINRALISILPDLLQNMQIIHLTGQLDWPEIKSACSTLPAELFPHYHPFPYLHEMGAALAAADLVVSRAGASTLGEYPLFGLPAVLVPYPYAWRYQKVNADYLANCGAAVVVEDADLSSQLLPQVKSLLSDSEGLGKMRKAMSTLAHPQAAQHLANELIQLSGRSRRGG